MPFYLVFKPKYAFPHLNLPLICLQIYILKLQLYTMLLDSQSLFEAHPARKKFIIESRTIAKR